MGGAAGLLLSFVSLVKAGFKQNLHVCLCLAENNISPYAKFVLLNLIRTFLLIASLMT